MPRPGNPWRPDFMAPGPHVKVEKRNAISFDVPAEKPEQDEDDIDDFTNRTRYYESEKVLGKLYRAIDEYGIFKEIQERLEIEDRSDDSTVIPKVWDHVQHACRGFQWKHHLEDAREIRDM